MKYLKQRTQLYDYGMSVMNTVNRMCDVLKLLEKEPDSVYLHQKLEELEELEWELKGDCDIIGDLTLDLQKRLNLNCSGLTKEESKQLPKVSLPAAELNRLIAQIKARRTHG